MYSLQDDGEIPTFRENLQKSKTSFLTLGSFETWRTHTRKETESRLILFFKRLTENKNNFYFRFLMEVFEI